MSMAINCPLIQGCQWAPLWVNVPAEAGTEGQKVHPQALLILPHEFLPRKDRLLLHELGTTRWSQLLLVKLQWPYNELQDLLTWESLAQVSFQLEKSLPATSQPFGMFKCVSLSAFVLLCDRWNILCISMYTQAHIKAIRWPGHLCSAGDVSAEEMLEQHSFLPCLLCLTSLREVLECSPCKQRCRCFQISSWAWWQTASAQQCSGPSRSAFEGNSLYVPIFHL